MQQKLIVTSVLAALLINILVPVSGSASDDKLTDMFQEFGFYVNNTHAGAYNAQAQGFITGGSLNVRSRYKTLRIGSITPPSIKAGCGGIDLFFGGVNFLNKQAYVDMLKSIGQNALGYAFELGLEAVCPTCNSVLKYLQNKANELSKYATDSCTAAKYLVNKALPVGNMAESSIDRCSRDLQELGLADEGDTARKTCLTDNTAMSKIYDKAKDNAQNDKKGDEGEPGIATPKAMKNLSAAEKALALNLLGTYVYEGPGDNSQTPELQYYGPTIGFKDIMFGKPDAKVYYPEVLNSPDYVGLANGDIDSMGDLMPYNSVPDAAAVNLFNQYLKEGGFVGTVKRQMEEILAKMEAGTGLTNDEKDFINASIVPVYSILEVSRHIEGTSNTMIEIYSGIMAAYMIEEVINGYVREAKANSHLQSQVNDESFITRVEAVQGELHNELVKTMQHYEAIFKSYEITQFFSRQLNEKVGESLARAITAGGGQK